MKVIIIILTFLFLLAESKLVHKRLGPPQDEIPNTQATRAPQYHQIIQRVDHFNPGDLRTWEMRYISNDQFFVKGGPIFIYLGGEWQIGTSSLLAGQIFDMAQTHSGYMFYTEHRYYGYSYPTEDMSSKNLRYLSLDQAIADVTYFIKYVKENIEGLEDSKVVVIGGSYSASMATWIRLKYPHIVDAAYSSSAPVRAVSDFYEYYEVVNDNIKLVSEECLDTIADGIAQLEAKLETDEGIAEMSESLKTCSTIQNVEPYRSFLFNVVIAEIFAGLVQYASATSIQNDCNRIAGYEGSALDKLVAYVRAAYGTNCIDDYDDFIVEYGVNINNTNDAYRPWLYQTCTEYGYYQTTTSKNQPFGETFGLEFFVNMCTDLFGENFGTAILDTGIARTNIFYGSLTPEITKVVSVHGTVDPWHALGILEDLSPLAPAILVPGTSHCADLSSVRDSDSEEMRAAKLRVQDLIAEWIK